MESISSVAVVFLAFVIARGCEAASVKYGDLGYFSYGSGCHHACPESPEAIVIKYWLYTPEKNSGYSKELLDRYDDSTIRNSKFEGNRGTKFIIHGYTDVYTSGWAQDMKKALVDENMNVIMVDWQEGAGRINYAQSRANTRVVGRDIGKLIDRLKAVSGASYGSMHIIGHSLGAHTAGYAGEALSGQVGRLTGLDPAGPEFTRCGNECLIDKSDAVFVDIIHTDGTLNPQIEYPIHGCGLLDQLGHQDFYPNGGEVQPGCEATNVIQACDHMRAVYLFTESIGSNCFSCSKKCTSWENQSSCSNCGTCPVMGYGASKSKGQGAFDLDTRSRSPFCY
ncbi:pancreatic lipase-related protein 2-like [Lytechinus pictus]|uniref:pancreatic lipase-related protein 2-like n=1 Tax=Lytechinus pictus TaxID=7653 RepID=UPI0030B9EB40